MGSSAPQPQPPIPSPRPRAVKAKKPPAPGAKPSLKATVGKTADFTPDLPQLLAAATDDSPLTLTDPTAAPTTDASQPLVSIDTDKGGKFVVMPGGAITYTPPASFVGADEFSYLLFNSDGLSTRVTATVTVTGAPQGPPLACLPAGCVPPARPRVGCPGAQRGALGKSRRVRAPGSPRAPPTPPAPPPAAPQTPPLSASTRARPSPWPHQLHHVHAQQRLAAQRRRGAARRAEEEALAAEGPAAAAAGAGGHARAQGARDHHARGRGLCRRAEEVQEPALHRPREHQPLVGAHVQELPRGEVPDRDRSSSAAAACCSRRAPTTRPWTRPSLLTRPLPVTCGATCAPRRASTGRERPHTRTFCAPRQWDRLLLPHLTGALPRLCHSIALS